MLRNRADELIKLFFSIIDNKSDDQLIEDFIDFLIDDCKYDKKICEMMDVNEDELCYLKIIAMEKIELLYYLAPNKNKELLKLLDDEIPTSISMVLQKMSINEIKELVYNYIHYLKGDIKDNISVDYYNYNDRKNNEYLKNVYDIYEIVLKNRKSYLEKNVEAGDFEELEEESIDELYNDVMDYLDYNYIDKEKFFKKFIINSYATSKIDNIDSDDKNILTVENYIESELPNLTIDEMINDQNAIFMVLEQSLESFLRDGYDIKAPLNVVNHDSMTVYLKLDPELYNKNILNSKTRIFTSTTSYIIFDIINDSLYDVKHKSLYETILNGDIYKYNRKYCLNEPLKQLMTNQIIKYLIAKFIEYCSFNYEKIDEEYKDVYNCLVDKDIEKLDSKYLVSIFNEFGQIIVDTYLQFNNINLKTMNKYRRNIYKNKLMDRLLYISPATTSEYFDIIDSKNVETIRLFKKMINIINEAYEDNFSPYQYFKNIRDYIESSDEELVGSLITILYENLLLDKNANKEILEYLESSELEIVINDVLKNEVLFNLICENCVKYSKVLDDVEKHLKNRKKKKIASKMKVISKINPFYQEEKHTCY